MMRALFFGLIALVLAACTASPAAQKRIGQQTKFFNRVMSEGDVMSTYKTNMGYEYTVSFNNRMYECKVIWGEKRCQVM